MWALTAIFNFDIFHVCARHTLRSQPIFSTYISSLSCLPEVVGRTRERQLEHDVAARKAKREAELGVLVEYSVNVE